MHEEKEKNRSFILDILKKMIIRKWFYEKKSKGQSYEFQSQRDRICNGSSDIRKEKRIYRKRKCGKRKCGKRKCGKEKAQGKEEEAGVLDQADKGNRADRLHMYCHLGDFFRRSWEIIKRTFLLIREEVTLRCSQNP